MKELIIYIDSRYPAVPSLGTFLNYISYYSPLMIKMI